MALPVAAWVTSFLKQHGASYPLVYHSTYDEPVEGSETADQPSTG